MPVTPPDFYALCHAVMEGDASPGEVARFRALVASDPACLEIYRQQMEIDVLLTGTCGGGASKRHIQAAQTRRPRVWTLWKRVAAAAALLVGAGLWYGVPRPASPVPRPTSPVMNSPVTMVEWKGAWGLEMPPELPGRIRLARGQVKVRLPSGVELSLLGPLELEAEERGMEVRLVSGRLVAWVPARAGGFTVRAPGLTAWDIGTVFSVAADAEGSSLFVFKGSVQALDGEGAGVDICGAGEGVRAMGDRTPFKVAVEGETGERLFKAVRGYAAIAEPQKALDAARRIEELWVAKYVPEEAERARETARRQAALRNAPRPISFTKTAWVRPSASQQKKEAASMSTTRAAAVLAAAVIMGAKSSPALSDPVFVNTSPSQNRRWEAVCTNTVPLRWEWNTNAANARLEIVGMNAAFATNFTAATSNYLWQAFPSATPLVEDLYELTLTFKAGGGAVVGAVTSRLAVVKDTFGTAGVISTPEGAPWPNVRENVLIPYDAGWTEATSGAVTSRIVISRAGITLTNALSNPAGYYGWRLKRSDWGYGTFNLALTFPGTVTNAWDATLTRLPEGFIFSVK